MGDIRVAQGAVCGQHGHSASSVSAGLICCLQMHHSGFAACSSGLASGGLDGEMLRS